MSNSLWPHYSPWNSPGQNTGVVAFPFSRGWSQSRDWNQVSRIAGRFFTSWATREALMWRNDSLEKTLMLGKYESRRRRGRQRMGCWMASPTQWTWVWGGSRSWWWTGRPGMLQSMVLQRVRHDWVTELNWKIPNELNVKSNWADQRTCELVFWKQWIYQNTVKSFQSDVTYTVMPKN